MDNHNPLISIVIPFFNGKDYIKDCVQSALNQDYSNIEVILVNDGSTDNSLKIAEGLARQDSRVKVVNQINKGVSAARNHGISVSKGEYITFVDVDDYISETFISYLYGLIIMNDSQISLVPQPRRFNEDSKHEISEIEEHIEVWSGEKAACQMLYYNIAIGPWNKLISCKLLNEHNIRFNESLSYGEGFNFSVDCFQRAKNVSVGRKRLYNYRVDNPNSVMTRFKLKLVTGSIEAQKCIRKNLVRETTELVNACKYANWHTYCDCLNTIIGCKVIHENRKIYKEIKKVCKKDASCALKSPVPKIDKVKGILYGIDPYFTAILINKLRKRKFTVEK